jgi:hypothetical protein
MTKVGKTVGMVPSMSLPPLYKYLDVQGAKLTLTNRNFKHAKASFFNDTEDLTIRSIFPENDAAALKQIEDEFTDVLLRHLDDPPTCLNIEMRKKVALLQAIFKANPDAGKGIKEAKARGNAPEIFNVEQMKQRNAAYFDEINQHMQGFRILCVSSLKDSERMWSRYGQEHRGILLRILPNIEKDSKYQLFKPVVYREKRPPLYESVLSFQEGSLFGNQEAKIKASMETIVYSKTLDWEYESEYRLAIPVMLGDDWNVMPYHPEEIAELYVGAKATTDFKTEIIGLAKAVNPHIRIYQMSHDVCGNLAARAV